MLKKWTAVLFSFAIILNILLISVLNSKPVFIKYSDNYEVYLKACSDTNAIKKANIITYPFILNKKGESCEIEIAKFNLTKFLEDFSATTVFIETLESGTAIYCYSKQIDNSERLKGEKVNLHIFVSQEKVKVGSPLIYGSF